MGDKIDEYVKLIQKVCRENEQGSSFLEMQLSIICSSIYNKGRRDMKENIKNYLRGLEPEGEIIHMEGIQESMS